jgi:Bacterial-like globin
MPEDVPSLYEWVGGLPALNRLTERFYQRVRNDATLAPIFAEMSAEHPKHVAAFLAEVLGGPTDYSTTRGGHPHMIRRHLNRHLNAGATARVGSPAPGYRRRVGFARRSRVSLRPRRLSRVGFAPCRHQFPG